MAVVRPNVPVEAGDTSTQTVYLFRISTDGTRKIIEPVQNIDSTNTVTADQSGMIPSFATDFFGYRASVTNLDRKWLGFPDATGQLWPSEVPTTPWTGFYELRKQLGNASNEYAVRYAAAVLAMKNADEHRQEVLNYELTAAERVRMGNVSLRQRNSRGILWRDLHDFAAMPFGTTANDALWRAEEASLRARIHQHCAEGNCMVDVATDHPAQDWKFYTEAGIEFEPSGDTYAPVTGSTLATPAAITNNILNDREAGRWFRRHAPDDDFSDLRSVVVTPPTLPTWMAAYPITTGNESQRMWRAAAIAKWQQAFFAIKDRVPATNAFAKIWRWMAAMNVIAILRDDNFTATPPAGFSIRTNGGLLKFMTIALLNECNPATYLNYNADGSYSSGGASARKLLQSVYVNGNATSGLDQANAYFKVFRIIQGGTVQLDLRTNPLIIMWPASELSSGEPTTTARTAMADKIEAIFGERILANSGNLTL